MINGHLGMNKKIAYGTILLLTLIYIFSFIDRQIVAVLGSQIRDSLMLSNFHIGLLYGPAFSFIYAISGIPMGRLTDRTSRKWMIAIGLFTWSLMTVLSGFAALLTPCVFPMIPMTVSFFTKQSKTKAQGIRKSEVTLQVGLGTFAPVKTEELDDHIMHSEWYQLNSNTAEELSKAKHITAVGTTSIRVLESLASTDRQFNPQSGETDIFITPGYSFKAVDALITNFHLPKSTLLMLVSALMGFDEMHRIYRHAIKEKYRFYSFGDAMLII
jgi:hypothetical protein